MATHPNAVIRICASDMILNIHSDILHLSASRARSGAGRYFFLDSLQKKIGPLVSTVTYTSLVPS